jgi:transposase InsO family protein
MFSLHNNNQFEYGVLFNALIRAGKETLCQQVTLGLPRVVYDNGNELVGQELQELLKSYGITTVATTIRSPKSNGVIERVHLTMGDMLRTMTFSGSNWLTDIPPALDATAW